MFSLFGEKEKMSIPKNLDECRTADTTARELWRIAEKVESWGATILFVIAILGLFSSLATNDFINDITREESLSGFFVSLIIWAIAAVIEYITYHLISLFISAIASVVQSTRVSAKVALYRASKDFDPAPLSGETQEASQPDQKRSGFANKANIENYSRNMDAPAVEPRQTNTGEIICPKCGESQSANRTVCWRCSQKFSQ